MSISFRITQAPGSANSQVRHSNGSSEPASNSEVLLYAILEKLEVVSSQLAELIELSKRDIQQESEIGEVIEKAVAKKGRTTKKTEEDPANEPVS